MRKAIPFVALFILIAADAFAMDAEYYTYNGFTAISKAWQFIALVFGNNDYKALFFSVIVLGMLIGGATAYFKLLSGGGKGSSLSWAWNIGFGVILYLAFFIPKGTLYLYDKVLNRQAVIGGIPDGLVLVGGVLSMIENGVVNIIVSSGQPLSFYDSAGGVGYDLLLKGAHPIENMGTKIRVGNVQNFIQQCVMFEMTRPGTTLTADVIATTNQSFIDLFSAATNDAVLVDWVFPDGSSSTISCTEAYTQLQSEWTLPSLESVLNGKCSSAGFDVTNGIELQRCKEIMEQTLNVALGSGGMSADQYLQQASISDIMRNTIIGGNLQEGIVKESDVNMKSNMMGVGLVANEYLPIIRAIITAVAIGMVPFVVIFLPTPLGSKAVGIVIGFFVWLTAWGITDALTHQLAIDYANNYFQQVRQNNIGFSAFQLMADAASRSLAMFGVIRTAGIMLATVLTTTLIHFGGHIMGMLAGQFSGTVQSAGQQAGHAVLSPQGAASAVSGFTMSRATLANAARFGFMESSGAAEFDQARNTESSLIHSSHLTEGGPVAAGIGGKIAGTAQGTVGARDTMTQIKTSGLMGGNTQYVSRLSDYHGGQGAGTAKFSEMEKSAMGFGGGEKGQELLKRFHEGGNVIDKDMASVLNQKYSATGQELFKEGMQVKYGVDSGTGQITNLTGTRQLKHDEHFKAFGKPFRLEQGGVETAYADGRRTFEGHFSDEDGHGGHVAHHGTVTFGKNGDMKNAQGDAGFQAMFHRDTVSTFKDLHTSEAGQRQWSGSDIQHVNRNESIVSHGSDFGKAYQMAIRKDSSMLGKFMAAQNAPDEMAEGMAVAQSLVRDISNMTQHNADSQNYRMREGSASAGLGLGAGKTGIGASLSGSVGDRDTVDVKDNMMTREILGTLMSSKAEAHRKGLSGDEANQYVASALHDKTSEITSGWVDRTDAGTRGASQIVSEMKEGIGSLVDGAKKVMKN